MGKSWRQERTDRGQRNREQRRGQEQRVPLDLSSLDGPEDTDYSDSYVYPEQQPEQDHA